MASHIIGLSIWFCVAAGSVPESLSTAVMQGLRGGDGCGSCWNCRYDGRRIDECAHFYSMDACRANQCIANYLLEDTCDASTTQGCSAVLNSNKVWLYQCLRADANCSTTNFDSWYVLVTHYYTDDGNCAVVRRRVRCQKSLNNCNGTLIDTTYRLGAVDCE